MHVCGWGLNVGPHANQANTVPLRNTLTEEHSSASIGMLCDLSHF